VCPTRYRTRHFFNNSNTNEDIATKFEEQYVRCVRNEEECVCSAPNCCDTDQRSASQPGSEASGTPCITRAKKNVLDGGTDKNEFKIPCPATHFFTYI
jgi:hypothetical protein